MYGAAPTLDSHRALIRAPRTVPSSRTSLLATTCHLAPYGAVPARSGSALAPPRGPLAPAAAPPLDAPDRTAQASTAVEDAILLALIDSAREVHPPPCRTRTAAARIFPRSGRARYARPP